MNLRTGKGKHAGINKLRLDKQAENGPALCETPSYKFSRACAAAEHRAFRYVMEKVNIESNHGSPVQLVKEGYWNVPPELRPADWKAMAERLGIQEVECPLK